MSRRPLDAGADRSRDVGTGAARGLVFAVALEVAALLALGVVVGIVLGAAALLGQLS